MNNQCDYCGNNVYDDEDECYYCAASAMDEDDWARMLQGGERNTCPYYVSDNEYLIVRKQN